MSLRIPRRFRAACAAVALAAYVLPLVMGFAAQISHGAEHALALLRDLEQRAAAMGVAHLHDAERGADRGHHVSVSDRIAYVHEHGGAPHAHDAGVGALLVAAEEADEHADETGIAAPFELSNHVPATGGLRVAALTELDAAAIEPGSAAPVNILPPPLPPPRA